MDHSAHIGTPWLDQPVILHSSREDTCELNPDQCLYRGGFWRYWYEADHRYALTTVYFCIALISFFTIGNILSRTTGPYSSRNIHWRRGFAVVRYASYRSYRIRLFHWYSPPFGYLLVGLSGTIFFFGLSLGPKPYYWPNTSEISFGNSPPLATRTGWMTVALLPFILALAVKANLISALTGTSHEKLQVFHRWAAYAMFVLALVHTFPFIVFHIWNGDMVEEWNTSAAYWTGIVAIIAQAYLTFMSMGPLRARFYEWFKSTHYLAAVVFVVFFFLHCDFRLSSWDYFIAAGVMYFACLLFAQLRTYLCYGGLHKAQISSLSSGMVEVNVPIRLQDIAKALITTGLTWKPGQHVFLRFPNLGFHSVSSHPFTICSLPANRQTSACNLKFFIAPSGGLTAKLSKLANEKTGDTIPVLIDGPYGGLKVRSLAGFDKVIIIAGGSGAGFTLPLIEDAIQKSVHGSRDSGLRNQPDISIVLATKSSEVLHWYSKEIQQLLSTYSASVPDLSLGVRIHVTGLEAPQFVADKEKADVGSDKSTDKGIQWETGRPDLKDIIETAASSEQGISLAITVCGPAEMLYDVRNSAANAQLAVIKGSGAREVYLHSEHFSW